VRLNFVFFTDSVSELYGQRIDYSDNVIDKEEKAILFLTLKTILASVDMHQKNRTRVMVKDCLEPPALYSFDRQGG
jgi:hypothetical protein